MKPIVVLGCGRDTGGANRENSDTCSLWQTNGIPVTIISLTKESLDNPWPSRLAELGCKIEQPSAIFSVKDSIVLDFCAERACRFWPELKKRGCKLVHVPCQCAVLPHEHATFRQWPPSAIVCQSEFQRYAISLQYRAYGVTDFRIIRGAFDEKWFPYLPCQKTNGHFVVGVIGRADPRKWPPRIVAILKAAKKRIPKLRAKFLGWSPAIHNGNRKLPPWIQHHPEGSVSTADFLAECHVVLCCSGYNENFSRVVLECFSSGVPVIADNRGGYCEQIEHGITGFLADNEQEAVESIALLDSDETTRLRISMKAAFSLSELCRPATIAAQWRELFDSLENS